MFLAGFSVETQIVSSGGVKPPSRLLDVAPGKIFIIYIYIYYKFITWDPC